VDDVKSGVTSVTKPTSPDPAPVAKPDGSDGGNQDLLR
jgi:hypothetical protein